MTFKKVASCIFFTTLLSLPFAVKFTSASTYLIHDNSKNDTVPSTTGIDTLDVDTTIKVEKHASFSGGERGWMMHLAKNMDMTIALENGAPDGIYTAIVQFTVGKDGKLYNIKPLTNHGFGMEEEVVRAISKSPLWTPAIAQGKNVNVYRKQPVTFGVEGQTKKKRRKKN